MNTLPRVKQVKAYFTQCCIQPPSRYFTQCCIQPPPPPPPNSPHYTVLYAVPLPHSPHFTQCCIQPTHPTPTHPTSLSLHTAPPPSTSLPTLHSVLYTAPPPPPTPHTSLSAVYSPPPPPHTSLSAVYSPPPPHTSLSAIYNPPPPSPPPARVSKDHGTVALCRFCGYEGGMQSVPIDVIVILKSGSKRVKRRKDSNRRPWPQRAGDLGLLCSVCLHKADAVFFSFLFSGGFHFCF